ncbi:MAG: lantibiotic biosynthesis protein [Actinomycetota bacterium]|nr:lantibiotic biosynthesis protein [Actinomycetota bacterium]
MRVTVANDRPVQVPPDEVTTCVEAVARRLTDPGHVEDQVRSVGNVEPVFGKPPWNGISLSHGWSGTALLFAELARDDDAWARIGHAHLVAASETLPTSSWAGGLFGGPAALGLAAYALRAENRPYTTLLEKLNRAVMADAQQRLAVELRRRGVGRGASWVSYDVISGLSGIGRYLVHAAEYEGARSDVAHTLGEVLASVIALAEPIVLDGVKLPGWHVPVEFELVEEDRKTFPRGDSNLGAAHGISGALAFLSIAARRGWQVSGQKSAIHTMAWWLMRWHTADADGPFWPARVSYAEQASGQLDDNCFTRAAWCYGTPGTAHALVLASQVLGDDFLVRTAVETMLSVLDRPPAQWRNVGPTFCHGRSGLLETTRSMFRETGDERLAPHVTRLTRDVLARFDDDHPFGFQHLVPQLAVNWRTRTEDYGWDGLTVAGLLEGAAGVALALLATARTSTDDEIWRSAFMLA